MYIPINHKAFIKYSLYCSLDKTDLQSVSYNNVTKYKFRSGVGKRRPKPILKVKICC